MNQQNDEISQLKKKLLSSAEETAELADSNTVLEKLLETKSEESRMTNMRMEKLLASTHEKVVELTNTNTSLEKTMAAKKEEADNTRTELEKALATLAEREAARDQLSGQASPNSWLLQNIERTYTMLLQP